VGTATVQPQVVGALIQGAAAIIAAVAVVGLGWRVGQSVAAQWALYQKRRELDLDAAHELYELYGEFFAIWKLWNQYRTLGEHNRNEDQQTLPRVDENPPPRNPERLKLLKRVSNADDPRLKLLERVSNAEGRMEALFIKIASEKSLKHEEWCEFGKFRHAFQRLRNRIQYNESLGWHSSEDSEYLTFKRLACFVATKFTADVPVNIDKAYNSSPDKAYEALHDITHNRHEAKLEEESTRLSFLRALSELTSSRTAMASEVAQRVGLDPERDPQDRALGERLAAELVEVGYASAEEGSSGSLSITPEGERAVRWWR
jgi:hypothetical protein